MGRRPPKQAPSGLHSTLPTEHLVQRAAATLSEGRRPGRKDVCKAIASPSGAEMGRKETQTCLLHFVS